MNVAKPITGNQESIGLMLRSAFGATFYMKEIWSRFAACLRAPYAPLRGAGAPPRFARRRGLARKKEQGQCQTAQAGKAERGACFKSNRRSLKRTKEDLDETPSASRSAARSAPLGARALLRPSLDALRALGRPSVPQERHTRASPAFWLAARRTRSPLDR